MNRRLAVFLASLILLALSVPAARGQTKADPNSPAGVEYQLPLERARGEGAATKGPPAPASAARGAARSGSGKLFGVGIGGKGQVDGASPPNGDRTQGGLGQTAGSPGSGAGGGSAPTGAAAARSALADRTGSSLPLTFGMAAAVILLGTMSGLLLRRRTRDAE